MSVNGEKGTDDIHSSAAETAVESTPQVVESSFDEAVEASQVPALVTENFPESAVEKPVSLVEDDHDDDDHEEDDDKVMSVIDHLDELRTRLLRALGVFALAMGISFYYGREIIQILEIPGKGMQFQALSIEEPIMVYFKVSFYAAIALSAPFWLYEVAGFIAPGLKKKERQVLAPVIIGGPLLFALGAVFAFYFVLPPMLAFFTAFSSPIAPVQQRLDYYISLVTTMIFYMGICFQLPIVLFALSIAGIVSSRHLIAVWRYAIVGSSVLAAIITPDPTVISMLIVMAALVALYFFTIILLKLFGR